MTQFYRQNELLDIRFATSPMCLLQFLPCLPPAQSMQDGITACGKVYVGGIANHMNVSTIKDLKYNTVRSKLHKPQYERARNNCQISQVV